MKKRIFASAATVLVVVLLLCFLQKLLVPKYIVNIPEGSLTSEYYEETTDHDVLFIGDCEVYENFSPVTLWEEHGITSYIRGNAQQLIWQSYYLLEDSLRYEKPDVVVFNVLSMKYGEPQNEAYNRLTLDGMRMSAAKLKAIDASMTEDEAFISYIFPLLRYHSRWNELTDEDFEYLFKDKKLSHNGFIMRADTKAAESVPDATPLGDYSFDEVCWEYLDKMTALCKENDIELVLIKAPALYPHWYDEWDAQIKDYADENDLLYLNLLALADEIGIDFSTDTYDMGLHLNLYGAEKLSVYFGEVLKENFGFEDHSDDEKLKKVWAEKVDFYNEMEKDQLRELKEYGYLKSYGARKPE